MEITINSPKYGNHVVVIDDEDYCLIQGYRWYVWRSKKGNFYAQHSWKRAGEEVTIKMHRIIMGITDPKIRIDHKNTDTLNNRKTNLRVATASQNSMNRGKTIKNKSGFKGVFFEEKKKLFRVTITVAGKTHRGGRFKNKLDAAKRYNELAVKYHGEFAFLNKV